MARHLIVTQPFGAYAKGDRIEETAAVEAAERENAANVVAVAIPDTPKKSGKDDAKT